MKNIHGVCTTFCKAGQYVFSGWAESSTLAKTQNLDVCTTDRYNNTYYKLCRLYNLFIVLIFPISRCNLAMECLGVGTGAVDWTTVVVSVGNNTLHL